MKKYGLCCPIRRANPYRKMKNAMKTNNYAPNLLDREFESYGPLLLCKQAAKIFQTICKKETALKRVLRNLLSAISFAQI